MRYRNTRPFNTAPVVVPANYVGNTATVDLEVGGGLNLGLRHTRSWGYYRYTLGPYPNSTCFASKNINPSAGVYDWTAFDLFFSRNKAAIHEFIVCLGFPADYLVADAAVGSAEMGGKSNLCPTDLVAWGQVVTAMVTRARDVHGVTGVTWELWNEFDVDGQFWSQAYGFGRMAAYARATWQAAKAADPICLIAGPSISGTGNGPGHISNFMIASDGAGGFGRDWIDCIGFHPYQPFQKDDMPTWWWWINRVRAAVAAGGRADLPLWITESGTPSSILPVDPDAGRHFCQRMIVFAALGVQRFTAFSYDEPHEGYSQMPILTWVRQAADILNGSPSLSADYDLRTGSVVVYRGGQRIVV